MKRLVLAVLFCIVCFSANAQLVIKQKISKEDQVERVCIVRPTYAHIYYSPMLGYRLSIKSSNRFDNNFWIDLGEDKKTCFKTLDLLILIGKSKDTVSAQSSDEDLIIKGNSVLGINAIFITGDAHAGNCSLNVSELESAYVKVKNYKGN